MPDAGFAAAGACLGEERGDAEEGERQAEIQRMELGRLARGARLKDHQKWASSPELKRR